MAKAIALISGGLDSILAAKIIESAGIEVIGIHFLLPFQKRRKIKSYGINVVDVEVGEDYFTILHNPKHGFGRAMNPCIDCKIFLLKKAKELTKKYGADFIVNGDVLGQRPMSQNKSAMEIIEKEAGVEGLLVRPLTAKNLPPTIPEKNGLVRRELLYDIRGRLRKRQIELAKKFGIADYEQPAGGCRLTEIAYAEKLKKRLELGPLKMDDVPLLSIGRHFFEGSWIILGRNERENKKLEKLAKKGDLIIIPEFPGPTALIRGNTKSIQRALELIWEHSKKKKRV